MFLACLCNNSGMAKKTTTTGKGRIVSPAPKSAKGKSTKTTKKATPAKKAGVKSRTKSQANAVASVRQANAGAGVKVPYLCVTLDKACEIADRLPTLTQGKLATKGAPMGKTATDAKARRDYCVAIGAPLVSCAEVAHENKVKETEGFGTITDRPENAVRARLQKRGQYAHKNPKHYYAVRAEGYAEGEVPKVWVVRL